MAEVVFQIFASVTPVNYSATDREIPGADIARNGTASSNILISGQCLEIGESDTLCVEFTVTLEVWLL